MSLAQQDFRKSLFAKDANIQVKLDYGEFGSFAVSGVYFAYNDGKLPTPMFDRVKSQGPDLTALANKQLSKLGDVIPDVGLGIKLKPKFLGFEPDKRKRRCGIQCAATVDGSKLLDFIPGVRFVPKGTFTLYPSQPYIVKDDFAAIIEGGNKTVRLQLGTTPLELRGYWVTIDPRAKGAEKFLAIKTNLGPSAGASEAVSFEITISCGMPVRGFAFDGKLKIGDSVTIGTVDGKITPSEFSGNFSIPPKEGSQLPIKDLINAKGSFRFRSGRPGRRLPGDILPDLSYTLTSVAPSRFSGRFDFNEAPTSCSIRASGSVEGTFEKHSRTSSWLQA